MSNKSIISVNKLIITILFMIIFVLFLDTQSQAKIFKDYKNHIEFEISDDYEIIRAEDKLYGFENDTYKLVYSVVENGEITDKLSFSSFSDATKEKVISTINMIGFNALNTDIAIKKVDQFSYYAEFEAKSMEKVAYKNIYYNNDNFYLFLLVAKNESNAKIKKYVKELDTIAKSMKECNENSDNSYYYEELEQIEDKKQENKEEIKDDNDKNNEILEKELEEEIKKGDKKELESFIKGLFDEEIKLNKFVAMLVVGSILAIILLRKFVIIFEHNYIIKYIVGIMAGYFAYRIYENFYYSMDYELNKFALITSITVILVLIYFPYKRKKTRSEKKQDEIDAKNVEIAMKSIDKM